MVPVPPLRERLVDVKPLVLNFIQRICRQFGIAEKTIDAEALSILEEYQWRKNNVRELQNIVERLIIECDGMEIRQKHIPADIRQIQPIAQKLQLNEGKSFQELKQEAEKWILLQYLKKNNWHISQTAEKLGIANHSNLLKMMRRLNIKRPE